MKKKKKNEEKEEKEGKKKKKKRKIKEKQFSPILNAKLCAIKKKWWEKGENSLHELSTKAEEGEGNC